MEAAAVDTLALLVSVAVVPLLLLGLFVLFAWRYRKAVAASMLRRAHESPTPEGGAVPLLDGSPVGAPRAWSAFRLRRQAGPAEAPLGQAAGTALADADARTGAVRLCFIAAGMAYWLVVAAAMLWVTRDWPRAVLAIEIWLTALPVVVMVAALSWRSWRARAIVALAYLVAGAGLIPVAGGIEPWRRTVVALAEVHALLPTAGLVLLLVRRLQALVMAFGALILYVVTGAALASLWLGNQGLVGVGSRLRWSLTATLVAGAMALLVGVALFLWALHRGWTARVLGVLIVGAVMADILDRLIRPTYPLGPIAVAVPGAVLQVGVVWAVFKLLVLLQERRALPAQAVHFHLATGFLTLYSMTVLAGHAGRIGASHAVSWLALLAFALAAAVLHTALRRVWYPLRGTRARRLLFLRAFGSAGKRELLLDLLDDSWRRVGRVDLVGGTDLALRTLSSRMLEAFLLQRVDARFLRTSEDVTRRLARLDDHVQGDARYPVNEVYCYADAWPEVVTRLAPASDVVLMDLRGFTRRNRGCEFELTQLIWNVPLARVVLVTDDETDEPALEEVASSAWATLPEGSPNASGSASEPLRVDLRGSAHDPETAVVRAIFQAAFPCTTLGSRDRVVVGAAEDHGHGEAASEGSGDSPPALPRR